MPQTTYGASVYGAGLLANRATLSCHSVLPFHSLGAPLSPKPNSHESVANPLRNLPNGDVTIATHDTQQPTRRRQTQKNRDKVQYPVSPLLALNVTSLDHLPVTSKTTHRFTIPNFKNSDQQFETNSNTIPQPQASNDPSQCRP